MAVMEATGGSDLNGRTFHGAKALLLSFCRFAPCDSLDLSGFESLACEVCESALPSVLASPVAKNMHGDLPRYRLRPSSTTSGTISWPLGSSGGPWSVRDARIRASSKPSTTYFAGTHLRPAASAEHLSVHGSGEVRGFVETGRGL